MLSLRCWTLLILCLYFISYFLSLKSLHCLLAMMIYNCYQSHPPTVLSWFRGLYVSKLGVFPRSVLNYILLEKLEQVLFILIFVSNCYYDFWYWPFEVIYHIVVVSRSVPAISTVYTFFISILRIKISTCIVLLILTRFSCNRF